MLTRPNPAGGEDDHIRPEILPGGQAVLFTITATTGGLDQAQVAVLDLRTGTQTVLIRGGSDAHYVSSGHLVYTAAGKLHAVAFDLARLAVAGTPVTVQPEVLTGAGMGGSGRRDAGLRLGWMYRRSGGAWCGWIGRAGRHRYPHHRATMPFRGCHRTARASRSTSPIRR